MKARRVEIEIDELIIAGGAPLERDEMAGVIETELARTLGHENPRGGRTAAASPPIERRIAASIRQAMER